MVEVVDIAEIVEAAKVVEFELWVLKSAIRNPQSEIP
jgi:hypothetical protein